MMDERGKSDRSIVPEKSPNNAGPSAAEGMEGRERTKGNSPERIVSRTQSRTDTPSALARVRQTAHRDKALRFTALLHHVYDSGRLRTAYFALKRDASAGIDGETWRHYGEELEANLQDLAARLQRGAYRAKPVRRAYIPKADGRQRPLGVPTLEDKIVQRAVVEVLGAIYETDFLGFSYGFRPRRSPHQALDALAVGIGTKRVKWVLDADLRSFFDTLKHDWLVKFVEHRIGDRRVLRLIQKWLAAGVLEDGRRTVSEVGTVQGGSVSPLLANIYLHYVFDLWVQRWRKKRAQRRCRRRALRRRLHRGVRAPARGRAVPRRVARAVGAIRLGAAPGQDATGRIRALRRDQIGGGGASASRRRSTFLGFTHICGWTRAGHFTVLRHTMRKRWQAKLQEVKAELRRRGHASIPELGAYLRSVVGGHVRYYGVPLNSRAIQAFRWAVGRLWKRTLERRSQRTRVAWARMRRLIDRWLPPARVCHPYPLVRLGVMTQGGSRMR